MDLQSAIQLMTGLLTPTVAVLGIVIGMLNVLHARRRRKDDLFDRRFQFYKDLRTWWLTTGSGAKGGEDPAVEIEDVASIADEARFLFGEDIERHIHSLVGAGHTGSPFFPDSSFSRPFERYLRL